MTRDEAIATVAAIWGGSKKTSSHQVDTLVALGILKLDEPKSPISRLSWSLGWPEGGGSYQALCRALDANSLRIVEK